MKMIKAVFFDLGNTLVNYHAGPVSDNEKDRQGLVNMQQFLATEGYQINLQTLYNNFYLPWLGCFEARQKSPVEFDVIPYLCRAIPEVAVKKHFFEIMSEFYRPTSEHAVLNPGVYDVFADLSEKHVTVCLISNTPVPGFCHDYTLELLNIIQFLPHRFYSYDTGVRKPDRRIFEMALHASGVNVAECVMVGDSKTLDIEPAAALGMNVCRYVPEEFKKSFAMVVEGTGIL